MVVPPGLPSGLPGAGVPTTVANLPPSLAELPAGSTITGSVTGRDSAGHVLLRTAAGTMAVATNLKLVRGNVVSMRVRGGPVFALAIETVDGRAPPADSTPPAAETAPGTAAAPAGTASSASSASHTTGETGREAIAAPAARIEISLAAKAPPAPSSPAASSVALPIQAVAPPIEAANAAVTVQEASREAPLDVARLAAGTRLTATVVGRAAAGHLLLRADAGSLSVTADLDLAPGNVVALRIGNGPIPMLVVESIDGVPPSAPLGSVAAVRPLPARGSPVSAPTPTPAPTPASPVAGGGPRESQGVVAVQAETGAPSQPVPSLGRPPPGHPPVASESPAPGAAVAALPEPSGASASRPVVAGAAPPPPVIPGILPEPSGAPVSSGTSMPSGAPVPSGAPGASSPPSPAPASPPSASLQTAQSGAAADAPLPRTLASRHGAVPSPLSPAPPARPGARGAAPWEAQQARGALAESLRGFSREWPELGEAVLALQQIDPGLANSLIQRVIPAPGANLGSGVLFFLSALTRGDLAGWLGREVIARLEEAGRGDVIGRLGSSFGQLARLSEPPAMGEWQALFVPLFDGETERQVRLFIRRHSRDGEDNDDGDKTRFIVELELDQMGDIQLDGLVREQTFDLILRSPDALPPSAKRDIADIFTEGLAITGFTGTLVFQVARDFPVSPIDDILAAEHDGLLV